MMKKEITTLVNLLDDKSDYKSSKLFYELVKEGKFKDSYELFNNIDVINSGGTSATTISDKCLGYHEKGKFTLHAQVQYDYYSWINYFIAVFDDGVNWVIGDFEQAIYASNPEAIHVLYENIVVEDWDYWDI